MVWRLLRAGGPMWVSPWCCLSVLSLEESSPKANNPRRKGRHCVEELAGVFLKPAQSVCSCPGFPEALFRSVQPEVEMWAEPEGGVPSGAGTLWSPVMAALIPVATAHWRARWEVESSFLPGKRRGQIWLNRGWRSHHPSREDRTRKQLSSFHSGLPRSSAFA